MSQSNLSPYQYELLQVIQVLNHDISGRAAVGEKTYKNPYDCLAALQGYQSAVEELLLRAQRQFDVPLATDIRSLSFGPGVWQRQRDGRPIPLSVTFRFQHPEHIVYDEACPF